MALDRSPAPDVISSTSKTRVACGFVGSGDGRKGIVVLASCARSRLLTRTRGNRHHGG